MVNLIYGLEFPEFPFLRANQEKGFLAFLGFSEVTHWLKI
jgi:hypothetical protein